MNSRETQRIQDRVAAARARDLPIRSEGRIYKAQDETLARAAGWAPVAEWHVMFKAGSGVARALAGGELYNAATDSLMSRPLRHAKHWHAACRMDKLEPTLVVFRVWNRKTDDIGNGRADVVALFPFDPGTDDAGTCGAYEHVGQHGSADPGHVVRQTLPATPAQYAALKAELEAAPYHYVLKVAKRIPRTAYQKRALALSGRVLSLSAADTTEVSHHA